MPPSRTNPTTAVPGEREVDVVHIHHAVAVHIAIGVRGAGHPRIQSSRNKVIIIHNVIGIHVSSYAGLQRRLQA